MVTIREVTTEDASEITVLSQQLGYVISAQQTLQNITALKQSKCDEVFVAVNEQKVIGWMGMSYKISLESPPLCEIHGLVVHENFRGEGIGKMLIEKAKQWTVEKGTDKLRLRCNIKRTEAQLFYKKIGFAEVKQQNVFEMKL
ncbi:MAG: GNAT family N-acetyltransferase [Ginsengibacter sp.]